MASLATDHADALSNSVASVPISHLAQLHHELINPGALATRSPKPLGFPSDAPARLAPNAVPRPHPLPHLAVSESAMSYARDVLRSQDALPSTLPRPFSYPGFPGGDTQLMESQVYRDFDTSMMKPNEPQELETPRRTIADADGYNVGNTAGTDKTAWTFAEGDTGYVNIVDAFHASRQMSPSDHGSDNMDDLLAESTQLDEQRQRPLPKTPGMAGNKHSRNGEILPTSAPTTGATKTPGYSRFFGMPTHGDLLSGTQLFNQTQTPSSPVPEVPFSDPVTSRPSPHAGNLGPASSPMPPLSSPFAAVMRPIIREGLELRESYTSMRESQLQQRENRLTELRAANLKRDTGLQVRFDEAGEGDSDKVLNDRKKDEMLQKRITINISTPSTVGRRGERVEFDTDDEGDSDGADGVLLDEEPEDVPEGDNDDAYDELGQTILRSQSHAHEDDEIDDVSSIDGDRPVLTANNAEMERDGKRRVETQPSDDLPGLPAADMVLDSTEVTAIADSQPYRAEIGQPVQSRHVPTKSSMASCVPGSQYTGKTSQDQFRRRESQKRRLDTKGHSDDRDVEAPIPSSPPVVPISLTYIAHSTGEEVLSHGSVVNVRASGRSDRDSVQEIPESDISPQAPKSTTKASRRASENTSGNGTLSTNLFSTAQTHVSGPELLSVKAASPLKRLISQRSTQSSQSPRKAAGVRRFAEIARTPSPDPAQHESQQIDIDAILSDVITADDVRHMDVIASPVRAERSTKRRAIVHSAASHASPQTSTSPAKFVRPAAEPDAASSSSDPILAHDAAETTIDDEVAPQVQPSPTGTALRNSPSKANQMAPETPSRKSFGQATPESVRRREKAGADAVSQALARRSKQSSKGKSDKRSKRQHKLEDGVKGEGSAKFTPKIKIHVKSRSSPPQDSAPIEDANLTEEANRQNIVTGSNEPRLVNNGAMKDVTTLVTNDEEDQGHVPEVRPPISRVFAIFRGINNYYPATWLATAPDGKSHRILFEDGTVDSVETHHICSLDLQLGDAVKIDIDGMRSKTWVITGFGDVIEPPRNTDIRGHGTIKVQVRSGRRSISAGSGVDQTEHEMTEVEVEKIYLPPTMWTPFSHRRFEPPAISEDRVNRAETPSAGIPSAASDTPLSRARRSLLCPGDRLKEQDLHSRDRSVASAIGVNEEKLFANMAFAISYGGNDINKIEVTRCITENGGIILEKGFDELFDIPDLEDLEGFVQGDDGATHKLSLCLKPEYENLGFVALIADRHSRKAKYIQALALGLPTLSGRWITDYVAAASNASTNTSTALPWPKYLLPAGESTFLGGAIRSRTLSPYTVSECSLKSIIQSRTLLLDSAGVLIVAPKKNKTVWERRRAYAFLTLALGATQIRRVADLSEAQAVLASSSKGIHSWDWIYVDGAVCEARDILAAASKPDSNSNKAGGAKGKRGPKSSTSVQLSNKPSARKYRAEEGVHLATYTPAGAETAVRIVNDEFVVQSLILGALTV